MNIPVHEISHDHFNEELEVISCHVCESESSTNFFIKLVYIQNPIVSVVNNLLIQLTHDSILRDSLSRAPQCQTRNHPPAYSRGSSLSHQQTATCDW